ncbi:MAG: 2-hydroxyacyl-CoA dehydratase [Clostridia bacterium]|nr:2-hydroxyacyl-CoA dehydratase [Clostridia bacterium]
MTDFNFKYTQTSNPANTEGLIRQAFDICKQNTDGQRVLPEAGWFFEEMNRYFSPESLRESKPDVIVLGTDFPGEIVHALTGHPPYWIIGGNSAFTSASDEDVPRDTDPVTRSVLGQLLVMEQAKENALVIVPCSSDAQRKTTYWLQKHGWKVVTLWIPAVKDDVTHKGFLSELEHTIRVICRHVGKRYSSAALSRSVQYMNEIRGSIHAFLDAARQNERDLPGNVRMAVLDSFFMTADFDEWHTCLKKLTAAIPKGRKSENPRVLLIGSPVYFPNFKIPCLLADAGVEICGSIDSRSGQYEGISDHTPEKGLAALAHFYFEHDSSGAFVWNHELMQAIRHYTEETKPDGILWHVLKGQIEYDFELNRCEKYFEEMALPVIRLETDYQYQDVEQLRIRIEAFGELLTQKKTEKGAGV